MKTARKKTDPWFLENLPPIGYGYGGTDALNELLSELGRLKRALEGDTRLASNDCDTAATLADDLMHDIAKHVGIQCETPIETLIDEIERLLAIYRTAPAVLNTVSTSFELIKSVMAAINRDGMRVLMIVRAVAGYHKCNLEKIERGLHQYHLPRYLARQKQGAP